MDNMEWIDQREAKAKEEGSKLYFQIQEGDNKFQLLSHCAPLAQKWTGSRYEVASEGDEGISIKGVCWVLQDGVIKSAKLPYTIVKAIRSLQNNEEWDFDIPFEHPLTLSAKGAGTKEVEYNLTPSPKKIPFTGEILAELKEKDSPEDIVEKIKNKQSETPTETKVDYPEGTVNPEDIPF